MDASRLLSLCLAFAPACIPVPLVAPPLQVAVGSGIADGGAGTEPPLHVRVGVAPLGLVPSLHRRPADAAAGWMFDRVLGQVTNGAYLEGSLVAVDAPLGAGPHFRLRPGAQARLLLRDQADGLHVGAGGALRLTSEVCGVAEGESTSSSDDEGGMVGLAFGEYCGGLYAESAVGGVAEATAWSVTGGIEVRAPLLFGIVWKWLWAK